MRQEVIDFYERNNVPIPKMIQAGVSRRNLSVASIEAVAESLYDEIVKGREYRPIRLAWDVFSKAKAMKAVVTAELQRKLEWYEQPWWKKIFRRPPNG